jgi:hypothetical protein
MFRFKPAYRLLWLPICGLISGIGISGCEKDGDTPAHLKVDVMTMPATDTLPSVIAENTLLTNTHTWYIKDWVYVTNDATLTIEPGTIVQILNRKNKTSGLVITRGSKIIASGFSNWPVLFQIDHTTPGWSGIVLLGRGPQKGSFALSENISSNPNGSGWSYGGVQPDDSSGVLQHVAITVRPYKADGAARDKFPEGLLLLGVGSKTIVRDIVIDTTGGRRYHMEPIRPE